MTSSLGKPRECREAAAKGTPMGSSRSALVRVVLYRWRGGNGVVGVPAVQVAFPDGELPHHVVVLVRQVVAVHHVAATLEVRVPARGVELDQQVYCLALADVDDVLGALLVRIHPAGPADPLDDPEVDQVDVDRVEPPARAVLELPDL